MNKESLIEKVAKDAGVSKSLANEMLDSVMSNIMKAVKAGDKVTLVGFGTFTIADRAARVARNPQTGELMKIKATRVPKFKAGKYFAQLIAKK